MLIVFILFFNFKTGTIPFYEQIKAKKKTIKRHLGNTGEKSAFQKKSIPSVKHGGGRKMVWDASGL